MRLVERPFLFIQSLLFFVSLECALPFALCRVVAAGSSAGSGTNSCVINHHAGTLGGGKFLIGNFLVVAHLDVRTIEGLELLL